MKDYKQHRAPQLPTQIKLLAGIVIALILAINAQDAESSEQSCLARIGFAEARGESVKGVQSVMNATVLHAKQLKISVCKVKAKQQTPSSDVALAYQLIANSVLSGAIKPANKSNSWRSHGLKPKHGKKVAHIGNHTFWYVENL